MGLFENIKKECETNNTTIAALERVLGLANGSIRRWNFSIPSVDKVQRIATYFHVSVDCLLKLTDDSQPCIAVTSDEEELFNNLTVDERVAVKAFLKAYREQKKKNYEKTL